MSATPQSSGRDVFIGVEALKARHAAQVRDFRRLCASKQFRAVHDGHFDWWAFPTDSPSGAHGYRYAVPPAAVAALKEDPEFIRNLRDGLRLVAYAWGWDLGEACWLPRPDRLRGQVWTMWPVRLYKMLRTATIFGCRDEALSLQLMGRELMERRRVVFSYGQHDLSGLFYETL